METATRGRSTTASRGEWEAEAGGETGRSCGGVAGPAPAGRVGGGGRRLTLLCFSLFPARARSTDAGAASGEGWGRSPAWGEIGEVAGAGRDWVAGAGRVGSPRRG